VGLSAVGPIMEESVRSNRKERRGGGSFKNLVVENGLLHWRTLGKRGIRLRLCVPKELREEIMEVCHSDIWSAFGDNQDAASVGGAILLAPDDSKY
jgi:hypothetical protein